MVELVKWMDKKFHHTLYWTRDYLSMVGLNFNHISKGDLGAHFVDIYFIYFQHKYVSISELHSLHG